MKKYMKIIIIISITILIILNANIVMATDAWKEYIDYYIPISTLNQEQCTQLMNALYEANTNNMTSEDKKAYVKIVNEWLDNTYVKQNREKAYLYYAELGKRSNELQNSGTTNKPTTPTNPTTPNKPADEQDYVGSSGVNDWEWLIDTNQLMTSEIAMLAIYAEDYLKTDISKINANNIDKYLSGIKLICNNSTLKTDIQYKYVYDICKARLEKLKKQSYINDSQRKLIDSYLEKNASNAEAQEGNDQLKGESDYNIKLEDKEGTRNPEQDKLANYKPSEKTSPDEIIGDASDFLSTGKNNQGQVMVNGGNVQKASNMLFNVLFTIAIAASVLIGIYLGIKFMMSSAEDKASIKESLLPYFVGVIIMFASFSIWRLVLVLLQSIDSI